MIESICRRNSCHGDEREDFASWAKLKLIDNDYAILSKFQGKSSLGTYLTTVIHNLFRDYRIGKWGKWRPSARARKQGEVAVQLETLLRRDGYTTSEAIEILKSNFEVETGRDELEAMAAKFPMRVSRRMENVDAIEDPAVNGEADDRVLEGELLQSAARTEQVMAEALGTLPAEDRLILKMRYQDGFTVASIASALDLEARPLYRRIERGLRSMRLELEERGLSINEVRELFGGDRLNIPWGNSADAPV